MKYGSKDSNLVLKLGVRKVVKESRLEDKETDGCSITFSNSSRKDGSYRSSEETNSLLQGKPFIKVAHGGM